MSLTADPLRGNAHLVDSLGHALRSGEHGLSTVPGLLKRVLAEESWREFITQRGEHVGPYAQFVEFVTTPPLKGLGATVRLIQKVVDAIEDEAERAEVQNLLDRALQNPHGGDRTKNNNVQLAPAPQGNAKDRALRKLRKDAPELLDEVLAGNLSAHAAMVKAGFRPLTITVRPDPEAAARTLRKHMAPEQLVELARLLVEG